tara:strand:- start:62 stop:442 length:381 start_codon:yes stop_codon:yes gene_type:complete
MQKFLLTFLITLFLSISATAENHLQNDKVPETETFDFYWSQMPTVCAPRAEVTRWLMKHKFVPVSVSFGKENGQADGRVVYAITMYIAENQMAAVAETQTSADVCVLFRTYDVQVNPNLVKPGLTL